MSIELSYRQVFTFACGSGAMSNGLIEMAMAPGGRNGVTGSWSGNPGGKEWRVILTSCF